MEILEISIFVKVVKTGSFGKAAKALNISKSTVSTRIGQLEERLGVTLLQRTTRQVNPTSLGKIYFVECSKALEILEAADSRVSQEQKTPQGLLRVTVPPGVADSHLPKILQKFSNLHPHVEVDVLITDRYVDLVGEGVDLAIRAGKLKDSNLIGKKIGQSEFGLFASPKYLQKNGPLRHPKDLTAHQCIKIVYSGGVKELSNGKEQCPFPDNGKIKANNLPLLKKLTLQGMGIALLDKMNSAEDVRTGKLVRVLPNWNMQEYPIYLVYPAHKFVSQKLREFMSITTEILQAAL